MRPQPGGSMTVGGEGTLTSETSPPGLLITIVEDNPLIRQLMAEEIEDEGHRVSSFSSAEEFLPVAAKLKSDLVLLDLMLRCLGGQLPQLPQAGQAIHPRQHQVKKHEIAFQLRCDRQELLC